MRGAAPAARCCSIALCVYNLITLFVCVLIFRKQYYTAGSRDTEPIRQRFDDAALAVGAGQADRRTPGKPGELALSHRDELYWSQWKQSVFTDQSGLANSSRDGAASNLQSVARTVEIWSKTGHGLYLWEHVLDGQLTSRLNGVWFYGEKILGQTKFKFRGGRGIAPDKVPAAAENVLLVLNGRTPVHVTETKAWLDALPLFDRLRNAALLLLGDERCANDWLLAYLPRPKPSRSGSNVSATPAVTAAAVPVMAAADGAVLLKQAFVIYDSPLVDRRLIRQWPLGVATYRGFPKRGLPDIVIPTARRYVCNFLGTVYKGSTRETLLSVIQPYAARGACYIKARTEWSPDETTSSMAEYVSILRESDLTLCPVGLNSETYRVYEAISMGSVPVVEDVRTPGDCRAAAGDRSGNPAGGNSQLASPLGVLKAHGAPIIFVKDWRELDAVLRGELQLSLEQRQERRRRLVEWYAEFLSVLKRDFVQSINAAFFNDTTSPGDSIVS